MVRASLTVMGTFVRDRAGLGTSHPAITARSRPPASHSPLSQLVHRALQPGSRSSGSGRLRSSWDRSRPRSGLGADFMIVRDSTVSRNGGVGVGVGVDGSLLVTNSTISDNRGSGVGLFEASLSLESSTITGNSTSGSGGGISGFHSSAYVADSTVADNTAALDGGGINTEDVTLINSTVSDNTAGGKGGGIHATYSVTLTDSTVSGNTASSSGGGIFLEPGGTAVLTGTNTFFNNIPEDCVGVPGC